jgi:hypothetical protein
MIGSLEFQVIFTDDLLGRVAMHPISCEAWEQELSSETA